MELTVAESKNSFNAKRTLEVGGKSYDYYALDAVDGMEKLPYSCLLYTSDAADE